MKKTYLLIALLGLTAFSCKKEDPKPTNEENAFTSQARETYSKIAWAVYDDSYQTAVTLQNKIDVFVANPTAQGLEDCKQAWLAARVPYGQSEIFRFTDGPIDINPGYEGYINAWPLDESFIDYVQGSANAGIINDAVNFPIIDKATLIAQNENGSETNIATGYHAIEFLLWGQDLTAPADNLPGQRPYTDYLTTGGTASNQARRGTYLKVCAELLVDMLKETKDQWDPAITGNYRENFLKLSEGAYLQKIFNQTATLSGFELSGERMYVAYTNQNQEDEHSCFSDNTDKDVVLNAKAIQNLIEGMYTRVDGTVVKGASLYHIVITDYPTEAASLKELADKSVALNEAIPHPFDNAIANQDVSVLNGVHKLQDLSDKLISIAKNYDIIVTL